MKKSPLLLVLAIAYIIQIPIRVHAQDKTPLALEKIFTQLDIAYYTHYLPDESSFYAGASGTLNTIYTETPQTIWWHWDAGPTIKKESGAKKRVYDTYNILKDRTMHNDPVSTHFVVGPRTILQMLPLYTDIVTQARLSNDTGIIDHLQAHSLGGIQIETTGVYYDTHPPLASQTTTLIILTATLMEHYHIPFSHITAHLEHGVGWGKTDPGINYLKQTRIKLLKYLIKNNKWDVIGNPTTWNFYTDIKNPNNDGTITQQLDQSSTDIQKALTTKEKAILKNQKL